MDNNSDPMAQPIVPYQWPNAGDRIYPGHELYSGLAIKPAAGTYVTKFVLLQEEEAQQAQAAKIQDALPINKNDFGQPDWAAIIDTAFPPWKVPANFSGCPRLAKIGGALEQGFETFPTPEKDKFNPCYYTKAFAGLDPMKGGYPTPIDTKYPRHTSLRLHSSSSRGMALPTIAF